MHKSSIFGLTLIAILFLAATTGGMSMQVSAKEKHNDEEYYEDDRKSDYREYDNSYDEKDPYSDGDSYSKSHDDSYGDSYGDKYPKPPEIDGELLACEECFKYWLHFLDGGNTRDFIRAISNAINDLGFGEDGCDVIPTPVGCLPVPGQGATELSDLAQVFEICEALDLLFEEGIIDSLQDLVTEATESETGGDPVINGTPQEEVLDGLIECLAEIFPNIGVY